ncbi:MAG: DUF302 domain-containing protein [Acidimicrobiales bacterium]
MNAIETTVSLSFADAEAAIRDALGTQGFGVLTEIDVAANLNGKLGTSRPPLKILGACNPHLADRALDIDPTVSLLLPCNIVLESVEGGTRVAAADPRDLMSDPAFEKLAADAAAQLQAAIDQLGSAGN